MTSVYVASSWRNKLHQLVVSTLVAEGLEVYDFRNPPGGVGFAWDQVDLAHSKSLHNDITSVLDVSDTREYIEALKHPRAAQGFNTDMDALKAADACVLVLPCGRSAHLELGWAVGAGKKTAVLLEDPCTPELMYKMVDHLAPDIASLMDWLIG